MKKSLFVVIVVSACLLSGCDSLLGEKEEISSLAIIAETIEADSTETSTDR